MSFFLYVWNCSIRVRYPLMPEEGTRFLGPSVTSKTLPAVAGNCKNIQYP